MNFLIYLAFLLVPHKTEVKFTIPDLGKIPEPLLEALKTGEPHEDILRRGIVVQEYVAVTKKNIFRIFRELQAAGIPFGSDRQMSDFLFPGKAQEIRLMRKSIKEGEQIKNIYQIGLLGSGEISSDTIETPEELTDGQMEKMEMLFASLQAEVNYTVRKLYFECAAGPLGTIEVDILLTSPLFIDGEIKFRDHDRQKAELAAMEFQKDATKHPSFFGSDVTNLQSVKTRNIAIMGLPSHVQALFEEFASSNALLAADMYNEYKRWADLDEEPKANTKIVSQKVLMSAEAFGFGPSAAIAEFFPYLRDKVSSLAYIGSGHTLNLQSKLPYDKVFDMDCVDKQQRQEYFNLVAKEYDVLITASDFEIALWAKQAGLKVIIYDPLTWYWPQLPKAIQQADFYIAQNFFGVAERLKSESEQFPESVIIPPIVSGMCDQGSSNTLLVNMGGLSNPYLEDADLQAFASVIFDTVYEVLQSQFQEVYFATSKKIAESLDGPYKVTTLLPSQIQEILSRARLAIMTSGLGNIYEASAMQKAILWLPPANDSQGQQIKLLQQQRMVDFAIDWHNILEDEDPIDYFAPQEEVLRRIAICMRKLSVDLNAQTKLKLIFNALNINAAKKQSALAKLAKTFEVDGAKQGAESILQWLFDIESKRRPFMSQEVLPSLSSTAQSMVVGSLYEHYKGHRYRILGVARHSETLEELVVYQALYGEGGVWVRPVGMFLENVVINGLSQPRFKLLQEEI